MMTLLPIALAPFLLQGTLPEAQGSISGHIVSIQTGQGIVGVTVYLALIRGEKQETSVVSSADGSFSFQGLAAGQYALRASKPGHQAAQELPVSLQLDNNQSKTGVEIKLHQPSVISGHLRDSEGEPLVGVDVTAYRLGWVEGRDTANAAGWATADDRGEYRISGLPAGAYLLEASPPGLHGGTGGGEMILTRTFYPGGAHASESSPVRVGWDKDLTGIDITLKPRVTFWVKGRIGDAQTGGPCRSCSVLASNLEDRYGIPIRGSSIASTGAYQIGGLTAGTYRVVVQKLTAGHLTASSVTVQIADRDAAGVDLIAGLDRQITGRLVFDSPPPDLKPGSMHIRFRSKDGIPGLVSSPVREDLSFEATGFAPEAYVVRLDGLPEGYVKAVRLGGRDLPGPELSIPEQGSLSQVEVVVGFDSATLTVSIKPPSNPGETGSMATASVVLVPAENGSPFLVDRHASTDPKGRITLNGVVPGSYILHALRETGGPEWIDPDSRRSSQDGQVVELAPGKQVSLEVSLGSQDQ